MTFSRCLFEKSPDKLNRGDILAIDRAYIDYAKFEEMSQCGVIYVTKMKQNLTYEWPDRKQDAEVKQLVLPPKNTSHRTKGYAILR